jgi:hypothetical protein
LRERTSSFVKVADNCIGPGLRQPAECLARRREREKFARKVVIELARYPRHPTGCVGVILASKKQPMDAHAARCASRWSIAGHLSRARGPCRDVLGAAARWWAGSR